MYKISSVPPFSAEDVLARKLSGTISVFVITLFTVFLDAGKALSERLKLLLICSHVINGAQGWQDMDQVIPVFICDFQHLLNLTHLPEKDLEDSDTDQRI